MGDHLLLFLDANKHVTKGKLFLMIAADGIHIEEFSHIFLGKLQPHTFLNGTILIDGAYKLCNVEVVNFAMLPFSMSPGNHRILMLNVTTCLMVGEHLNQEVHPVSR